MNVEIEDNTVLKSMPMPTSTSTPMSIQIIPHRGSLSRIHIDVDNKDTSISYNQPTTYIYAINIVSQFAEQDNSNPSSSSYQSCQYQLQYHPDHYKFMYDLFIILDTESRGYITKQQVYDFVFLRCPVFKRRDAHIQQFEATTCNTFCFGSRSRSKEMNEDVNHHCRHDHNINNMHVDMTVEKQNQQDIFNCVLGEDFHSASFSEGTTTTTTNDDDAIDIDEGNHAILFEEANELYEGGNVNVQSLHNNNNEPTTTTTTMTIKEEHHRDQNSNAKQNEKESSTESGSRTFEEIWNAVIQCTLNQDDIDIHNNDISSRNRQNAIYFGIEAWMVFCRFISLAQYQDATRRFSARHLRQELEEPQKNNSDTTNANTKNEVIIVDVPPPTQPDQIRAQTLIEYELLSLKSEVNEHTHVGIGNNIGIALPEFDLDHSHLLLHDGPKNKNIFKPTQKVQVSVFGGRTSSGNSLDALEFVIQLTTTKQHNTKDKNDHDSSIDETTDEITTVVRRTYADVSWLHNTFKSQKHVSGTLCGRIIPPFPSPLGHHTKVSDFNDDKALSSSTAISVASESAVLVTSAAKSFLGSISKSASKLKKAATKSSLKSPFLSSDNNKQVSNKTKQSHSSSVSLSSSHRQQQHGLSTLRKKRHTKVKELILDNPSSKAKQLERYLNYMLDHPAMSTSFPLNVILRSSQAGVDSAKRIMEKCKEENWYNPDAIVSSSCQQPKDYKFMFDRYILTSDLSWVRTAAQAALALKLHGILETTGYRGTSAKLHHASLPKFSKLRCESDDHDVDEESASLVNEKVELNDEDGGDDDFEKGIVCIETCLDATRDFENNPGTGFDVLPLPVPLHKRSALCAGSSQMRAKIANEQAQFESHNEFGTVYGDSFAPHEQGSITIGDVSVDRDINRLRDMMRTVDKSLSSGVSAGLLIGAESSEKMNCQLELLKEIDIGDDLFPRFISQNSVLYGIESLERNRDAMNQCTEQFVNDLCWNSALASCAVSASDEVREAVTASKTAQRAKHVAEEATKTADNLCSSLSFSSLDDKMHAMTQASDLRSQAIYAAVVDHEALTAKRRAAVALVRDVKCWNVHRKQELIMTCINTVKNYQKIAFDSINTWTKLKQSLLESQSVSNIVQSRTVKQTSIQNPNRIERNVEPVSAVFNDDLIDSLETTDVVSTSFTQSNPSTFLQASMTENCLCENVNVTEQSMQGDSDLNFSLLTDMAESMGSIIDKGSKLQSGAVERCNSNDMGSSEQVKNQSAFKENSNHSDSSGHFDIERSFHDTFQEKIPSEAEFRSHEGVDEERNCPDISTEMGISTEDVIDSGNNGEDANLLEKSAYFQSDIDSRSHVDNAYSDTYTAEDNSDNGMTESMQSLVDGLMNWGGQYEDEAIIPLPHGLVASLMEESGVLNSQ